MMPCFTWARMVYAVLSLMLTVTAPSAPPYEPLVTLWICSLDLPRLMSTAQ